MLAVTVASDSDYGFALVDGNADGAELEAETWLWDDSTWTGAGSTGAGPLSTLEPLRAANHAGSACYAYGTLSRLDKNMGTPRASRAPEYRAAERRHQTIAALIPAPPPNDRRGQPTIGRAAQIMAFWLTAVGVFWSVLAAVAPVAVRLGDRCNTVSNGAVQRRLSARPGALP